MADDDQTEAEAQAEKEAVELWWRVMEFKCRRSLAEASDLMMHIRGMVVPGGGTSFEVRVSSSKEPPAPLRLDPEDDSNLAYAQLVLWVWEWARLLGVLPPSTAAVAWYSIREVQGFRASTTPEGAHLLTRLLTSWLLMKHPRIIEDRAAVAMDYLMEIVQTIGTLRGRYPMRDGTRRASIPDCRPCPVCGLEFVTATWNVEDSHSVDIVCVHCGATGEQILPLIGISPSKLGRILDWLDDLPEGREIVDLDLEDPDHLALLAERDTLKEN